MANWRPEGFQAEFFEVMNKYRGPDPEGVRPSSLWGVEEHVRERFGPYADEIRVEPRMLPWRFESLEEMGTFFASSGPGSRTAGMSDEKLQQMGTELMELVDRFNEAEGGAVAIDAAYSIVVARKKS